jgi:GT2 family glycosyltransferase
LSPSARRIDGVSAVVCNYQGEAYLEDCLRSIVAEEGVDELVVVDDASTDASVRLVQERFPTARVLALPANRGPGAARNAGMRAARHRFVLAVDNDVVLRPGALARLRAALAAQPEAVVAQPRSLLFDEPGRVHYDGGGLHYCGLYALRNFYRPLAEAEGTGVVGSDAFVSLCALVDRDALLALGGYDEELFYLAEDLDLALRLGIAGHALVSVEDAEVLHRGGTAGLSFRGGGYPRRRAYLASRNRWWILAKCYRARTLAAAAPGLLAYELVWLLFGLLQGQLGAHLAGKRDALRGLRARRALRAAVQETRRRPDRDLLAGGPLTLSPSLVRSGPARAAAGLLDLCLRGWWALARRLTG